MSQRNSEYTHDDYVVNTGTDVFGIIELGNGDVAGFPGQEHPKGQQQTFVDVYSNNPVRLQRVGTVDKDVESDHVTVARVLQDTAIVIVMHSTTYTAALK